MMRKSRREWDGYINHIVDGVRRHDYADPKDRTHVATLTVSLFGRQHGFWAKFSTFVGNRLDIEREMLVALEGMAKTLARIARKREAHGLDPLGATS